MVDFSQYGTADYANQMANKLSGFNLPENIAARRAVQIGQQEQEMKLRQMQQEMQDKELAQQAWKSAVEQHKATGESPISIYRKNAANLGYAQATEAEKYAQEQAKLNAPKYEFDKDTGQLVGVDPSGTVTVKKVENYTPKKKEVQPTEVERLLEAQGVPRGSPQWNQTISDFLDKKTHITVKTGGGDGNQRGQIIFDAQGNAFNVNPYTNTVQPVVIGGKQIQGAQYSPDLQGQIAGSKALSSETGKATGEATASLKDIESQMPNLEKLVTDLSALGKKATYTKTGQYADIARRQLGMDVGEGAIARKEYISKVDNEVLPMLRQTFGAAFTQKEGESLRATLGDPDASPEEKDAVLRSFIQTKKAQVESLKRRTDSESHVPVAPQPTPTAKPMATMPPASSATGRIVKDTNTGIRYKSDGARWVRVQ